MPISINHLIKEFSEKEFHDLDYRIMNLAFQAHNDLGRFYDEKIYQASAYQSHLQRFLPHTHLKQLHWINIHNQRIEFKTLSN